MCLSVRRGGIDYIHHEAGHMIGYSPPPDIRLGDDWRPVRTCSFEETPTMLLTSSGGHQKQVVRILLEWCLVNYIVVFFQSHLNSNRFLQDIQHLCGPLKF